MGCQWDGNSFNKSHPQFLRAAAVQSATTSVGIGLFVTKRGTLILFHAEIAYSGMSALIQLWHLGCEQSALKQISCQYHALSLEAVLLQELPLLFSSLLLL